MAHNDADSKSGRPPWKVTLWAILIAGFLVALADMLTGANRLTKAWGDLRATLTDVFGPKPREMVQPFENLGPYTGVGCGESSPASTTYTVPTDAYEIQHRCDWIETANLKAEPCSTAVDGTTVKASGSIVGRDRDWTGNCPGGGHGRLKLSGSYKHKVR